MDSVEARLEAHGLGRYAKIFAENDIDLDVLPDLSDEDLQKLGISLGHRKKLGRVIAALSSVEARESRAGPGGPLEAPAWATAGEAERRQLTVMFCDLVGST
jgi:class 3 adenylate cyclase